MEQKQPIPRLFYRIHEAAESLGISRSGMYEKVRSGEVPSVKIGKSVRIPVDALAKWANSLDGGDNATA